MSIKRLPPYAKNVPEAQSCIIFCTGSKAWYRAKSKGWISGHSKTLLPLNDDIEAYKFSFAYGKEVLLFSHGQLESYERLIELSRAILSYGALLVKWCIPEYPANKIIGKVAA